MARKTKKAARGKKLAKAKKLAAVKPLEVTFNYGSTQWTYTKQGSTGAPGK